MSGFGLHIDPPLGPIPGILAEHGVGVFQTTLRDPRRLSKDGTISRGDRVVAVLTGHILKDPGILLDYHKDASRSMANTPIEIDAEISAVEGVLKHALSPSGSR